MREDFLNEKDYYNRAKEKARTYFQQLEQKMKTKDCEQQILADLQKWQQTHKPLIFNRSGIQRKKGYRYLHWLKAKGALDAYLDRSISYIFLRDLGKSLQDPETKQRIQSLVEKFTKDLTKKDASDAANLFSIEWLYRQGKDYAIESTIIWLIERLTAVKKHLPEKMDPIHSQRKLVKIIAGVVMHELEEMDEQLPKEVRAKRLDQALRLGYSYGLTYPLIDDLLDSDILSKDEQKRYSNMIRTALITGVVPELGEWTGENGDFIRFAHGELRQAFNYIKAQQPVQHRRKFLHEAYVFFQSQEEDRLKSLNNATYTNEQLFIPIILKSASSRLMARTVLGHSSDTQFTTNTFLFGIYNQLADDFSDFFSDFAQQAVTPYTYYFTYRNTRNDLINPFELFWTVTATLIYDVYQSDAKTRDIILTRAINSLKRFKEKWGTEKFMDMMEIFSISNRQLQQTIQKVVHSAPEMEFLDKLLRDQMIYNLNEAELERKAFKETIEVVRARINKILPIIPEKEQVIQNDVIIEASNYSLQGEAKRLRPIISWFIGVNMYKLNEMSLEPLLKSLEYMHTASLIFDDLPAQDNASLRRGRKTVHQMYNTAIAELTGLFLSQKAIEEQTSLPFDTKRVLQVIQYSAKMTMEMCKGQMMDLQSDGRKLTLEQLKQLSVFKTGLGFEAALLLPAILAGATEAEKNELRQFAKHAGIAFQIKDDLLDVEGESSLLGKEVGMDQFNQKATYVSVLGVEGAKQQMWEHYCQALDCLQKIGQQSFLKQMLEYIVTRSR